MSIDIDLSERTALVTGSTAGIGQAIAIALARAGARVIINGRTEERVAEALDAIRTQTGAGDRVNGIPADVGTAAGCELLAARTGGVDVLVNNAGAIDPKPFLELKDEDWTRSFELNVMSGVRLARALLPAMLDRGWGRVVFISSESALHIPAEMVDYGMTKAAQLAVSRGIAESNPGSGVTVNCVLPGPTRTETLESMLEQERREGEDLDSAGRRFIAEQRPTSLLGRPTSPEEVANMVAYLCSPLASATNGAAVRADGGVVRAIA